jgi:hypothetical protein
MKLRPIVVAIVLATSLGACNKPAEAPTAEITAVDQAKLAAELEQVYADFWEANLKLIQSALRSWVMPVTTINCLTSSLPISVSTAIPGQVLAYKIGELKIQEQKRKAQSALGAKFDPRAFHAEVLKDGSVPLPVLEAKIDRWIAEQD